MASYSPLLREATERSILKLSYARTDACCASFRGFLEDAIDDCAASMVCDVGGGANPLLGEADLRRLGLECTLLDISAEELAKAPRGYQRLVADIAAPDFRYEGPGFDLVYSRMLAEHVRDARQFHRNVRQLLRPGGMAVHCFPTLYSLPFVVNRVIPETLASRLLDVIQPRDRWQHAKFPAYYRWCRGPSARQLQRFAGLGYEVVEYRGLFGHPYYGERGPLAGAHRRVTDWLLRHPAAWLTSYAYVCLRAAG